MGAVPADCAEIPACLELEACVVDLALQRVLHATESVALTTKETEVLSYLAARPNAPVSRDQLLRDVWGYRRAVRTRAPDLVVLRLRQKIEKNPDVPRHILTVTGQGYRFVPLRPDERPALVASRTGPVWISALGPELAARAGALAGALMVREVPVTLDRGLALTPGEASALVWLLPGGPLPELAREALQQRARSAGDGPLPVLIPVRPSGAQPVETAAWGPASPGEVASGLSVDALADLVCAVRARPAPPWPALQAPAAAPALSYYIGESSSETAIRSVVAPEEQCSAGLRCAGPQPPGTPYHPAWYARWPALEAAAAASLEVPGAPVVIQGPGSAGKSWLLEHLLTRRGPEVTTVRLDLRRFSRATLESLPGLLGEVALELLEQTGLDIDAPDLLEPSRGPRRALDRWLETRVLPALPGPLWLALDNADLLSGSAGRGEGLTMLRAWASNARAPWDRLRLLLTISTEPALLMDRPELSPFNLSAPLRLGDLDAVSLGDLAVAYGLQRDGPTLTELSAWVGGHPYLSRLALHALGLTGGEISGFVAAAQDCAGPWGDHLRARLLALRAAPALAELLRAALADPRARLDPLLAHRLVSAGLLVPEGPWFRVRYPLYTAFFERHL